MTDIVEFLTARLDEREQIARQAVAELATHRGDENMERWSTGELYRTDDGEATNIGVWFDDDSDCPVIDIGVTRPTVGKHIARHDPAWVLADVATKRKLVGGYAAATDDRQRHTDAARHLGWTLLGEVIQILAAADADHPDYDPAWRP
jgi:hypothetical protein